MEEFVLWKQKYIHHLELQRGLRQNSLRAIQKDLEQFLSYIEDCQEKEFTVLAMKSYFFSLQEKYAASTVHRKLSSIKVFLRFLKEENIVRDRKSTRLNSSHANISYAVFCLKKKKKLYENNK